MITVMAEKISSPIWTWLMRAALVCFMLAFAIITYWAFFDDPSIFHDENLFALEPVRKGEPLRYHAEFCHDFTPDPYSISRTITGENGEMHLLAPFMAAPKGCYSFERSIDLPSNLKPGKYFYQFTASYPINPIKNKIGKTKPMPFEIIP